MTAPENTLFPFGVATQQEVIGIIRSQCIDDDVRELDNIMTNWREASKHFQEIVQNERGIPESIIVKDIGPELSQALNAVASEFLFKQSFSLIPIEFKLVEIGKMVAPQRLVNIDYVEELKKRIPADPKLTDLVEFCLRPKHEPPQPRQLQLAANVMGFSSPSSDFRFIGGYPKQLSDEDIKTALGGGLPSSAILLLVGYGSPTCNVFSIGRRIIVNNGFHRMYALGALGIEYAPVVVQKVTNHELEVPDAIAGLPKDYLINNPRPVLMKDFFDSKLVRVIHKKPRMRNVQLVWNVQQTDVPV